MFRNYEYATDAVKECYRLQRINQTLEYSKRMIDKYCTFTEERHDTFWNLFDKLNNFVDLSDPDITLPNHQHLFQTAEGLRNAGHPEWMQVTGLIHDLGKILYERGCDEDGTSMDTQWGIVGDTYVLGCKIPDTIVYNEFNELSKDKRNKKFSTKLGIYKPNIGLDNLTFTFGHDEYLYRLLVYNNVKLPPVALHIIRYHSCYLWHSEDEYKIFENNKDKNYKSIVKIFNKFDLYTKQNKEYDYKKLRKYYEPIVNKYFPDRIYW